MQKIDISRLDLLDLRLLVDLTENRRIGPVAVRHKLSRAAVSYRLDKLRTALADALFLRESRGLRPTERGETLARAAKALLDTLEQDVAPKGFDPKRDARRFTIVCSTYETSVFLGHALREAMAEAHHCQFRLIETNTALDPDRLHSDVDLALLPVDLDRPNVNTRLLFRDPYRVFGLGPLPVTAGEYACASHAVVAHDSDVMTNVDVALGLLGLSRQTRLTLSGFEALGIVLRGGGLISTLPSRLGCVLFAGLQSAVPPVALEDMPLYLVRSRTKAADAGLNFLEAKIDRALSRLV